MASLLPLVNRVTDGSTGAQIFNTLAGPGTVCTTVFQLITAVLGVLFSLPRTLKHVSLMSVVSAVTMLISILLSLIYAATEPHPGSGYEGDCESPQLLMICY